MNESLKALMFYRVLMAALKSDGIKKVLVTLGEDGDLQADIVIDEEQ
jgi:fructose-1-phosphate kinase PfkB-like protein